MKRKKCLLCTKEVSKCRGAKFCSRKCAAIFNNSKRRKTQNCLFCKKLFFRKYLRKFCSSACLAEYNYYKYIENWKKGLSSGLIGKKEVFPAQYIKRFIFEKYKNKCCKCGWHKVNKNTSKIPLQIHHIDGNCLNNKEENLELLCPNCHSLTETYGSLNRGFSQRKNRHSKAVVR